MEEVNEYIESGILELYVLGQLNDQEELEVQEMAARYPAIKQEIEAIENAMERYAVARAVQPTIGLDQRILTSMQIAQPTADVPAIPENPGGKVVPMPINYESKIRTLRVALVACIAFLLVSVIALFSARTQLGHARNEIASLSQQREQYSRTVNYMRQDNADLKKIVDMTDDPNWKTIQLAGTTMDPEAKMVVYWHSSGNHVMVDNSKMHLPSNDKNHQYQLWALVNGKPVDLGVFDIDTEHPGILKAMKDIASAQTFAVTLEQRGGSPSPTMEQMIVAGNVI